VAILYFPYSMTRESWRMYNDTVDLLLDFDPIWWVTLVPATHDLLATT
jgi:hypothetical protein